jgi:hypothetical protein
VRDRSRPPGFGAVLSAGHGLGSRPGVLHRRLLNRMVSNELQLPAADCASRDNAAADERASAADSSASAADSAASSADSAVDSAASAAAARGRPGKLHDLPSLTMVRSGTFHSADGAFLDTSGHGRRLDALQRSLHF